MIILLAALLPSLAPQGTDWPQWRGPTRDGVWMESGVTTSLPDVITPRWSTQIGSGYCGPTVADGRVYVMDRLDEAKEIERVRDDDIRGL